MTLEGVRLQKVGLLWAGQLYPDAYGMAGDFPGLLLLELSLLESISFIYLRNTGAYKYNQASGATAD